MTAQLAAPAASGPVMMTEQEARGCLEKIRLSAIAFRDLLIEFEDREGWAALGYDSWAACATAAFGKSTATVYKHLRAARFDRELSHGEKNSAPLPIRQADHLARLDTPADRREAYAEATFVGNGKATEATVKQAVERRVGPKGPRPTLTSGAVAADNQEIPDETYLAGDAGQDLDPSNEVRRGPLTSHFCSQCGPSSDHTSDLCPFIGVDGVDAGAPLTDRGGDQEAEPGALPVPASGDAGTDASPPAAVTPDWPGSASPSGDVPPDVADAPDAGPTASEQPAAPATPRTNGHTTFSEGVGGNKKASTSVPSSRVFADRQLDAGDLSRTLLDMSCWLEALTENATADQKRALRQALGGSVQPAPATAPTIADVKAQIDRMETGVMAVCSYAFDKLDDAGKRAMLTKMQTQLADRTELGMARLAGR